MLVVESQIQDDEQLFTENSKSSNVDEFEWPDGLTTPPLKNVRKRRFRKRISAKKIEDIEKEVEKLLHEDSLAEEVKLVWEDAIDSETATPAAYIGSKAHEEEEQEEVEEVQGEEDDYDVELEEDTTVLGEEILDEDQFSTPDDDLQKEFENALERFDEMSDSSDKNDDEETTESEESTSESDEDEDEDPELTQILNKREELTTDIAKLEEEIKNFESHFASAINPLIQERLTGKITTAKEDLSQKQQEIETGDKRIAEIQERMKAQVAELKRLSKEKMKGKRRESDEDSENETENENSSEEEDDEQNEEENKKDDKQEEDKDSKKDDSMFLLGEDEFYEEELNNKDDDDGDNKEETMTVDNDGQDENEGDIMDIEDDDKEKSKEGSEKSQHSNDEG